MNRALKVLVAVDMQNDFIDGSLGTAEAQAIVPNVVNKIKSKKYDLIVATRDTHLDETYEDSLEGRNLPVRHCIFKEKGWQIQKDVDRALNLGTAATVVRDNKFTFGQLDLPNIIDNAVALRARKDDVEEIEVVGLCTDICVISNAMILRAGFRNTPIIVDSRCCAGTTPENHENALRVMECCQITVI